jgi:hypothetical protein
VSAFAAEWKREARPDHAINRLAFSHYNSLIQKEQVLPARVGFVGAPAAIQFKPIHYRKIYRVSYRVFMRVW